MRKFLAFVAIAIAFAIFLKVPEEGGQSLFEWMRGEGKRYVPPAETPATPGEAGSDKTYSEVRYVPPAETPENPGATSNSPAEASPALRVRLVSARGEPIPALRVLLDGSNAGVSDKDGYIDLGLQSAVGVLSLEDSAWFILGPDALSAVVSAPKPALVAAKRATVHGTVLDAAGAPVEGAEIHGYVPLKALATPELARQLPERIEARTRTASDGTFVLTGLPEIEPTRVEVFGEGFGKWSELIEERGEPLRIVLSRE